ncbi:MAG TPA: metallophosphoesterase [Dehalococcoidia bacterium]|nr:metallophosphoesterase [Dehalococcoidia bacterium]
MARVLVCGDIHEPVSHPQYLPFCKSIGKKYKCNKTVLIGDIADLQAISFHASNPQCPGPEDERLLTKQAIRKWYKAFPKACVCIGNHDDRIRRLAESVNIPVKYLRDDKKIWGTPGWKWDYDFVIDNVYYLHGTGHGGIHPAYNVACKMLMSVVMGHCHARAGVKWKVNPITRIFAMDVGCGVDVKAWQFAYGRHIKERPVLACGVVINGTPYHEIMPINPSEKFSKDKLRNGK